MGVIRCADYYCVGTVRGGKERGEGGVVVCFEGGSQRRTVGCGVYEGDEGGAGVREVGLCVPGTDEAAAYYGYVEL